MILSRHSLRQSDFDSDPGWLGPLYDGVRRGGMPLERRAIIDRARKPGSLAADVVHDISQALRAGRVIHTLAHVMSANPSGHGAGVGLGYGPWSLTGGLHRTGDRVQGQRVHRVALCGPGRPLHGLRRGARRSLRPAGRRAALPAARAGRLPIPRRSPTLGPGALRHGSARRTGRWSRRAEPERRANGRRAHPRGAELLILRWWKKGLEYATDVTGRRTSTGSGRARAEELTEAASEQVTSSTGRSAGDRRTCLLRASHAPTRSSDPGRPGDRPPDWHFAET